MFIASGVLADYWKKLYDDGLFGFGASYEVLYREDFQLQKGTWIFRDKDTDTLKQIYGPYLVVDFLKSYKEKQQADCCNNVIYSSEWRRNYVYCLPSEVRVVLTSYGLYQEEKPREYTDFAYGWSDENKVSNEGLRVKQGKKGKFLEDLCDRYNDGASYKFKVAPKNSSWRDASITEFFND